MTKIYEPVLHFRDISYSINEKPILNNITGSFPKGKVTTLVGPSGAGKTTLLKLCNGLISPSTGEVFFNNKLIQEYEPVELRRQVGMALQSAPVIKGNVFDNLSLPLMLQEQKLSEQMAVQFLNDVGLSASMLDQEAGDLSGGQRQKVSIARTLINRPRVLLLDEITSALDATSQKEVEQLIININKKYDVTIIWITHNLDQALSIGDYTWVLKDGELIEAGESSLLTSTKNEFIRRFVRGEAE